MIQNQVSRLLNNKGKEAGYYKKDIQTSLLLDNASVLAIHQLGVPSTLAMGLDLMKLTNYLHKVLIIIQ